MGENTNTTKRRNTIQIMESDWSGQTPAPYHAGSNHHPWNIQVTCAQSLT